MINPLTILAGGQGMSSIFSSVQELFTGKRNSRPSGRLSEKRGSINAWRTEARGGRL